MIGGYSTQQVRAALDAANSVWGAYWCWSWYDASVDEFLLWAGSGFDPEKFLIFKQPVYIRLPIGLDPCVRFSLADEAAIAELGLPSIERAGHHVVIARCGDRLYCVICRGVGFAERACVTAEELSEWFRAEVARRMAASG